MPRPSRSTDTLLIQAGRKLLPETGVSGLTLRRVAAAAKVNLGMFHYHFGSKREFARRVLTEIYEEFFRGFSMETGLDAPPKERLRGALAALARFARDNRKIILAIVRDVMEGDAVATEFAKANIPRHMEIIAGLVKECQRRGELKDIPLPLAMSFLLGAAAMPNVAMGVIERSSAKKPFGLAPAALFPLFSSDKSIAIRVDLALSALTRERT
ncbi:MAG: TetR/AcrR family transcriptional regulator [Elusimicrobia bacterium]|nr:TetR/AcrR family transcriptional regulator [Elusimicrobiota bacterium]